MLPLSEADPEIKAKVTEITGACKCSPWELKRSLEWLHDGRDPVWDPECVYHNWGEEFANLLRENRRLRLALARVSHYNQLRKVQS